MSTTANGATGIGHVDQIREIIVGDQFRSLDTRLESLERAMLAEVETVRKELAESHGEKERELNKEIHELGKQLETERAARLSQAESLNGSMIDRDALASALTDIAEKLRDGAI